MLNHFGGRAYSHSAICPNCRKPIVYIGDPYEGMENDLCQCGKKKASRDQLITDFKITPAATDPALLAVLNRIAAALDRLSTIK